MQKKFFALCFLIGALGTVSLQAMNKDADSYKFSSLIPSRHALNNFALRFTLFNEIAQVAALIVPQWTQPVFTGASYFGNYLGATGSAISRSFAWKCGGPLFLITLFAKPIAYAAYAGSGHRRSEFVRGMVENGEALCSSNTIKTAALLGGATLIGAALARRSTPTGIKF